MATFYKHSGEAPVLGLVNAFICGLVIATIGGIIYGVAVANIPFIYLNFLITCCFGGFVGWSVYWIARKGHIRSHNLSVIIALVCGFVGLYVAWGTHFSARSTKKPMDVSPFYCYEPQAIMSYAKIGYEEGFWRLGRSPFERDNVKGIWVVLVWLFEAGLIVGIPALMCSAHIDSLVYCENCSRWTSDAVVVRKVEPTQALSIVEGLQQGNVTPLAEAPLAGPTSNDFLRVKLQCCDGCAGSNYLTLERVRITIDAKKNKSEKSDTLIDKLAVSADDVALLCNPA